MAAVGSDHHVDVRVSCVGLLRYLKGSDQCLCHQWECCMGKGRVVVCRGSQQRCSDGICVTRVCHCLMDRWIPPTAGTSTARAS